MKNKNSKHYKTIHQRVEQILRHRISVLVVVGSMFFCVLALDSRFRGLMQQVYAQGWGWIGTYMHHEHPAHAHSMYGIARMARIAGPQ
ncbi:MAG TPA: hypothetical protein VF733_01325 [Candidatus Saccharimonadales bacterium]